MSTWIIVRPSNIPQSGIVWSHIQPALVEYMATEKAARLSRERTNCLIIRYTLLLEVYAEYVAAQTLDFVVPPVADIALSEAFQSLMVDTPYDVTLTAESFTPIVSSHLPAIIAEWQRSKDAELVEILAEHVPGATLAHLQLATTVFKCRGHPIGGVPCNQPLTYPRVLAHGCTLSLSYEWASEHWHVGSSLGYEEADLAQLFTSLGSVPWNYKGGRTVFSEVGASNARAAVKACGLDPEVATVDDMNALDPMLECRTCSGEYSGCFVMRWMATVCARILSCIQSF